MPESVGEALREASAELTAKPDGGEKSKAAKSENSIRENVREAPREVTASSDDDDADFGAPGWVKQWKKPSRAALRKLASMEGAADLLPEVYKEVEARYDYTGKQQAEFDQYRKRWDSYAQVLTPLEQRFAMQGIHPQTGLQQMAAVSQALAQDPDQVIPWLLQMYQPRDAKALVQAIAQAHQVDLGALAAGAPYVDPVVSQELNELKQQNAQVVQAFNQLTQYQQNQYQQQYQAAAQQVAGAIQAFKSETDENGNPKYPYYDLLDNTMAAIMQAEGLKPIEELYKQALGQHPELARMAESYAKQEAQRRNAEAEKAMGASRNINGKTTAGKPKNPADLRALLKQESKRLSG